MDSRYLDAFPAWLKGLSSDACGLCSVLGHDAVASPARMCLAGALNYLFKSLDLIPDGIEDLGFVDDAFVFRVASAHAVAADPTVSDKDDTGTVKRLAEECEVVRAFLGEDFPRLEKFVRALGDSSVRGRSASDVITNVASREALIGDVEGWASSFQPPTFGREEKNLVKLRSFLGAKLPS